jgi:geranylgeranyl diphosphate synthase type I
LRPTDTLRDTPQPPDLTTSVPPSLSSVAPAVEARIDALLADEASRWGSVDPELVPPIEALRRFVLDGGKRLRPAFCHWAHIGAGGAPDDPIVIDAGAALELLHAFALLHDDVMDGSSLRRGHPTVHVDFATRHSAAGWRGEARRFGEGVAILLGDLAFVYADLLMVGVPHAATAIFNELRVELNIGQALDLIGTAEARHDLPMARRIATYKSGKYTIERPLHLGAALIGRLTELAESLSAYGLPLGEAFQMRDDVLGAFGDPDVTGKPVGEDLREGKPTPLLAITTARAGAAGSGLLDRVGSGGDGQRSGGGEHAFAASHGLLDQLSRRHVGQHPAEVGQAERPQVGRGGGGAGAVRVVRHGGRLSGRARGAVIINRPVGS